jgi:hypothetical protein
MYLTFGERMSLNGYGHTKLRKADESWCSSIDETDKGNEHEAPEKDWASEVPLQPSPASQAMQSNGPKGLKGEEHVAERKTVLALEAKRWVPQLISFQDKTETTNRSHTCW